ncbi:RDD family protein [Paenibacillus sp. 1001270B_150601_E10]|uniref:RDD family protein n=1 Tax=Paenibacillus sp. 1001270B_150601_E10 TaxID=2787079 RepID=UPI0018A0DB7F|nr:RDD family protein [Paenibacillus sp. 1001270B_150601_E10]
MNLQAGFWIRLGAAILDGIIIGIPVSLIMYILFSESFGETMTNVIVGLYSLLLPVMWAGYTIGKKICNIRIQKLDGSPPTLGTMFLRNIVSGLIYGITFGMAALISAFMVGLREDKRAIHDFIAGTEVVHD